MNDKETILILYHCKQSSDLTESHFPLRFRLRSHIQQTLAGGIAIFFVHSSYNPARMRMTNGSNIIWSIASIIHHIIYLWIFRWLHIACWIEGQYRGCRGLVCGISLCNGYSYSSWVFILNGDIVCNLAIFASMKRQTAAVKKILHSYPLYLHRKWFM